MNATLCEETGRNAEMRKRLLCWTVDTGGIGGQSLSSSRYKLGGVMK